MQLHFIFIMFFWCSQQRYRAGIIYPSYYLMAIVSNYAISPFIQIKGPSHHSITRHPYLSQFPIRATTQVVPLIWPAILTHEWTACRGVYSVPMLVFGNGPLDLLLKEMAAVEIRDSRTSDAKRPSRLGRIFCRRTGLIWRVIPVSLKWSIMVNYRRLRTFAKLMLVDHIILIDCGGDAGVQADAGLASQLGHPGWREYLERRVDCLRMVESLVKSVK